MTIEEIFTALRQTHPADLPTIKRFVAWVKFRRRMHNEFYLTIHWVHTSRPYHWV
jgi:hypothetical protein